MQKEIKSLADIKLINIKVPTASDTYVVYKAEAKGCDPYYGVTGDLRNRIDMHRRLTFDRDNTNYHYKKSRTWRHSGVTRSNFNNTVTFTIVYETNLKDRADTVEKLLINSGPCLNDAKNDKCNRAPRPRKFSKDSRQRFLNIETGEVFEGTSREISKMTGISAGNLSNLRHNKKDNIKGLVFQGLI